MEYVSIMNEFESVVSCPIEISIRLRFMSWDMTELILRLPKQLQSLIVINFPSTSVRIGNNPT